MARSMLTSPLSKKAYDRGSIFLAKHLAGMGKQKIPLDFIKKVLEQYKK